MEISPTKPAKKIAKVMSMFSAFLSSAPAWVSAVAFLSGYLPSDLKSQILISDKVHWQHKLHPCPDSGWHVRRCLVFVYNELVAILINTKCFWFLIIDANKNLVVSYGGRCLSWYHCCNSAIVFGVLSAVRLTALFVAPQNGHLSAVSSIMEPQYSHFICIFISSPEVVC